MHDGRVSTCSATFDGDLSIFRLKQWIKELIPTKGQDLFRYKGILAVKGMEEKFVFNGVHMMYNEAMLSGQLWQPGEQRRNTFVFIGRNLDKDALVHGFEACRA